MRSVTPAVFGATGTTSGQYYLPNIMNKLFGTKFKIIPGYKTFAEIFLSMERGELDGVSGAYEAILEGRPQWIAEKRFNQLAQLYDERPAQFADVPLMQELAQRPIDKAAFRFLALARIPGKMLLVAAGGAAGAACRLARRLHGHGARPRVRRRRRQDQPAPGAAHLAGRRAHHPRDDRDAARGRRPCAGSVEGRQPVIRPRMNLLRVFSIALAFVVTPAVADEDVAAFYRGKTLTITNAFAEGGLYANLARLIALHMPRHIPGRPNAVPQFMPGAAGLRHMNHLYNAAAKDGTVIALMYDNMPITQVLTADDTVKFDARRFSALGSLSRGEPGIVGVLKRAGIATMEDAKRKESVFGATGTSSAQYYIPAVMNRLFGTRFKLIPGFPTTPATYLAMERGEVDGVYGAVETILENRPQWIAEKQFNWLAQLNDVREGEFADVPLLEELAQAPIDKAAFRLLALARVPGKPLLLPPEVPAARVAALRDAFSALLRDPAFIADVAKTTQKLEPRTWQDAERVIRETVNTTPDVVAHVRELLKVAN